MPDVLVRDVSVETLDALKAQAEMQGRSLQAELKLILDHAARKRMMDARAVAAKIRRSLGKRPHRDSVALLREDRRR